MPSQSNGMPDGDDIQRTMEMIDLSIGAVKMVRDQFIQAGFSHEVADQAGLAMWIQMFNGPKE